MAQPVTKYILFDMLLAIFCSLVPAQAKVVDYQMHCDLGKGYVQERQVGGFTVRLKPTEGICRGWILDPSKNSIFYFGSRAESVFITNELGGTAPVVIIERATLRGAELILFSLDEKPHLMATVENQSGFWLQDDCGGRVQIFTSDGTLESFPDLEDVYHWPLFFPVVVLGMQGGQIRNATASCEPYFDGQISSLRSRLKKTDIVGFRSDSIKDEDRRRELKGYILKIVFLYLYTGRDKDALSVLDEMWPAKDKQRIWTSITKLKSDGVLRQVSAVQSTR
jgi:hypothetical protein